MQANQKIIIDPHNALGRREKLADFSLKLNHFENCFTKVEDFI